MTFVFLRSLLISALFLLPSQKGPAGKKLSLADFKGPVDERAFYLARTYTVISMRYSSPVPCPGDRTRVHLNVETGNRVSEKSWLKADRINNRILLNELLSHEQGHFDIGEAFAFELKAKIFTTCFDPLRYKVEADSILRAMNKRYDALQLQYDSETRNMQNRTAQLQWKKKIENLRSEKERECRTVTN